MGFCYFLAGRPKGGPEDCFSGGPRDGPKGVIANPMAASLG